MSEVPVTLFEGKPRGAGDSSGDPIALCSWVPGEARVARVVDDGAAAHLVPPPLINQRCVETGPGRRTNGSFPAGAGGALYSFPIAVLEVESHDVAVTELLGHSAVHHVGLAVISVSDEYARHLPGAAQVDDRHQCHPA